MVAKCDLTFNNPVLLYIWLSPYVSLTSLENICEIAGHDRDVTLPLRVLQQKKKLYIWHNLTSSKKKNKEKNPLMIMMMLFSYTIFFFGNTGPKLMGCKCKLYTKRLFWIQVPETNRKMFCSVFCFWSTASLFKIFCEIKKLYIRVYIHIYLCVYIYDYFSLTLGL